MNKIYIPIAIAAGFFMATVGCLSAAIFNVNPSTKNVLFFTLLPGCLMFIAILLIGYFYDVE